MPIDLNREEFGSLPQKQRDMIVFDNLNYIKKSIGVYQLVQSNHGNQIKTIKQSGFVWGFILTVALGLRKFLPI